MYLVDSSVWIDYFRGASSPQTDFLGSRIERGTFIVGDLILTEVLQGTASRKDFDRVLRLMSVVGQIEISSREVAIEAARNYRHLRSLGITVRKTIDTLIATRCIRDDIPLLYSDRDFVPFVEHLGLKDAMAD
jgi:predicted nucleic acid-binding protein